MTELSAKKPWRKPEVRDLGSAEAVRTMIDAGAAGHLAPKERDALDRLLPRKS